MKFKLKVFFTPHDNPSMSEKCLICKFKGKSTLSSTMSTIYQRGQNQHIPLCYSHSVEFFKSGQVKFMLKYQRDFREHGFNDQDTIFDSTSSLISQFR